MINIYGINIDIGLKDIFYSIFVSFFVVGLWTPRSKWVSNFAPNLDRPTIFFGIGVFLLAFLGIELFNGSAAIALVSALTAFVAIYRLRRPDKTERPAVRQSFENVKDKEYMDFGLKNYGPEPALYLQVEATLESSGETLFKFGPRDHPVHLQEGDFLGFIHDDRSPCEEFFDVILNASGDKMPVDDKVYFYYSYVSPAGIREPEEWNNELDRPDDTILEDLTGKSKKPRQMEVSKVWNLCSKQRKGKAMQADENREFQEEDSLSPKPS